jgi:hypothetical protein
MPNPGHLKTSGPLITAYVSQVSVLERRCPVKRMVPIKTSVARP